MDWYGAGEEMPLIWKENAIDDINVVLNRKIEEIYLLEHSLTADIVGDKKQKAFFKRLTQTDFFIVGIEFKLAGIEKCLHLSNGLDCNEMKIYTTAMDIKNRRIKIE